MLGEIHGSNKLTLHAISLSRLGPEAHECIGGICHLHMITQGWKGMHSGVVVVVHSKLNNYDAVTSAVRERVNYGSMAGPLAACDSKRVKVPQQCAMSLSAHSVPL